MNNAAFTYYNTPYFISFYVALNRNSHLVIWLSQSIAAGIIAIVMSRNLHVLKLVRSLFVFSQWYDHFSHSSSASSIVTSPSSVFFYTMLSLCLQQIGLLIVSFLNALLSAACSIGLLLAISVTVAHNGQGLMLGCSGTQVPINARSPVSAQCPFDTTRIYVSLNFTFIFSSLKRLPFSSSCNFWDRSNGQPFSVAYTISFFAGHHPGTVDPLCCVVCNWGWTVCLVLHRWIGSQRAGSLWEQLHQRAGVCMCLCVGWVWICLSDSDMHTWS